MSCIAAGYELIDGRAGFEYYFIAGTPIIVFLFKAQRRVDLVAGLATAFTGWLYTTVFPPAAPGWRMWLGISPDAGRVFNFVMAYGFTAICIHAYLAQARRQRDALARALGDSRDVETTLSRTLHHMREGVMIQDPDGRVLRQNDAIERVFGPRPADAPVGDVFSEDGRPVAVEDLPFALASRTNRAQCDRTLRIVRPDGTSQWVLVNSIPFGGGVDATDRHVITTVLDVTTRKDSEDLLYQIVNSTPDWIFIKDRAHRYLMVNASYAGALKRTPADILGRTDLDLGFSPDAVRGYWADDDSVLDGRVLKTFENDHAVIDGETRNFHTVKTPIRASGQAEPYGVLAYARDMTEQKSTELRLLQSAKMASLGQMAGGIAHEINNPLAIIDGRSRLLLHQIENHRLDDGTAKDALLKITATVDRVAKIVRGLRAFSHGGDDNPFADVSLRAVIDDSLDLCAERFRAAGLRIEVDVAPEIRLKSNAIQLSQVLVNLLNNAHDAVVDLGERWIHLGVTVDDQVIRLTLTDSGRGIPPAIAARLTEPFFTTKPQGRGTGLGLVISRRIVERHGGRLFLNADAPNTTFVIELPSGRTSISDPTDERSA